MSGSSTITSCLEETCKICLDSFPATELIDGLCGLTCVQKTCKSCISQHLEFIVSSGFDGTSPTMSCPFHPKRIVPSSTWRKLVQSKTEDLVKRRVKSTLSLFCGGCHSSRDLMFKHDSSISDIALIPEFGDSFQLFVAARDEYLSGDSSSFKFLSSISEFAIQGLLKGNAQGPCTLMTKILQSLDDSEREGTLHVAYLRRFPECYTLCCRRRHCFRCHIRDFHDGVSCEQYQASKTEVEDVVPCPQCGLQLTKGDGCNSVVCVCGKKFDWSVELKKIQIELSKMFETETIAEISASYSLEPNDEGNPLMALLSHIDLIGEKAARRIFFGRSANTVSIVRATAWESQNPVPVEKARAGLFESLVIPHIPCQLRPFAAIAITETPEMIHIKGSLPGNVAQTARSWIAKADNSIALTEARFFSENSKVHAWTNLWINFPTTKECTLSMAQRQAANTHATTVELMGMSDIRAEWIKRYALESTIKVLNVEACRSWVYLYGEMSTLRALQAIDAAADAGKTISTPLTTGALKGNYKGALGDSARTFCEAFIQSNMKNIQFERVCRFDGYWASPDNTVHRLTDSIPCTEALAFVVDLAVIEALASSDRSDHVLKYLNNNFSRTKTNPVSWSTLARDVEAWRMAHSGALMDEKSSRWEQVSILALRAAAPAIDSGPVHLNSVFEEGVRVVRDIHATSWSKSRPRGGERGIVLTRNEKSVRVAFENGTAIWCDSSELRLQPSTKLSYDNPVLDNPKNALDATIDIELGLRSFPSLSGIMESRLGGIGLSSHQIDKVSQIYQTAYRDKHERELLEAKAQRWVDSAIRRHGNLKIDGNENWKCSTICQSHLANDCLKIKDIIALEVYVDSKVDDSMYPPLSTFEVAYLKAWESLKYSLNDLTSLKEAELARRWLAYHDVSEFGGADSAVVSVLWIYPGAASSQITPQAVRSHAAMFDRAIQNAVDITVGLTTTKHPYSLYYESFKRIGSSADEMRRCKASRWEMLPECQGDFVRAAVDFEVGRWIPPADAALEAAARLYHSSWIAFPSSVNLVNQEKARRFYVLSGVPPALLFEEGSIQPVVCRSSHHAEQSTERCIEETNGSTQNISACARCCFLQSSRSACKLCGAWINTSLLPDRFQLMAKAGIPSSTIELRMCLETEAALKTQTNGSTSSLLNLREFEGSSQPAPATIDNLIESWNESAVRLCLDVEEEIFFLEKIDALDAAQDHQFWLQPKSSAWRRSQIDKMVKARAEEKISTGGCNEAIHLKQKSQEHTPLLRNLHEFEICLKAWKGSVGYLEADRLLQVTRSARSRRRCEIFERELMASLYTPASFKGAELDASVEGDAINHVACAAQRILALSISSKSSLLVQKFNTSDSGIERSPVKAGAPPLIAPHFDRESWLRARAWAAANPGAMLQAMLQAQESLILKARTEAAENSAAGGKASTSKLGAWPCKKCGQCFETASLLFRHEGMNHTKLSGFNLSE